MPGQGTIIGVGAMEYPAEYQGASAETLARLGISKIDHADLDLRPPDHPGRAVRRVPAEGPPAAARRGRLLRRDLRRAAHPVRAGPLGPGHLRRRTRTTSTKPARVHELIHAYRVRGHLMADTDPLEFRAAQAPRPGHQPARADPVGPGAGVRHRRLRRQAADEAARDPRRAARLLLPHRRHGVHAHPGPGRAAPGSRPASSGPHDRPEHDEQLHILSPAERGRGVRDVPADQVRRPEAVLAGGRASR